MDIDIEIAFCRKREAEERGASRIARAPNVAGIHEDMADRYAQRSRALEVEKQDGDRGSPDGAAMRVVIFDPVVR